MKENINSFSIPSLNYYYLPYLCLSFKKQKLSKLQRQKKIIPVKKIRKLDFDIILITYLLYLALMLCFGQKNKFFCSPWFSWSIHTFINKFLFSTLTISTMYLVFPMLKRDHIGANVYRAVRISKKGKACVFCGQAFKSLQIAEKSYNYH